MIANSSVQTWQGVDYMLGIFLWGFIILTELNLEVFDETLLCKLSSFPLLIEWESLKLVSRVPIGKTGKLSIDF